MAQPSSSIPRKASSETPPSVQLITDLKRAYDIFFKTFTLAFGVRYGISTILRCLQILRKGDVSGLFSLNKLFGEKYLIVRVDAVRLGLAFGGFAAIYDLLSSVLGRLIIRRYANLKGLNNFLGGLIGGLTMLFLERDGRRTISLYVLGRVFECIYNSLKSHNMWHFWGSNWNHGDTLLFCLASAQVMYAYVMRPETIDATYYNFIVRSGPIAEVVLQQVRTANRGRPVDLEKITKYLHSIHPLLSHNLTPHPSIIPCSILHPQNTSCTYNAFDVLTNSFQKILPLYATLTFVPVIILKFSSFIRRPLSRLNIAVISTLQSTLFLSTFIMLYQSVICIQRKVVKTDFRFIYWLAGFIASLSLLIEKKSRRAELALYSLPRGIDSLYMLLLERKWMATVPHGELLLFSFSMGSIMYFYDNEPNTLTPYLKSLLDRILCRPKEDKKEDKEKREKSTLDED